MVLAANQFRAYLDPPKKTLIATTVSVFLCMVSVDVLQPIAQMQANTGATPGR
jgi:hypothetical protein